MLQKKVCLGPVKHATGTDVCAKRSYSLLTATTRLIRGWQNMKDRYSTHFSAMLQIKLNVFGVRFTVHLQWVRWAGNMQWVLVSGGCIFYLQVDRFITGSLWGGELISGGLRHYGSDFLSRLFFTVS